MPGLLSLFGAVLFSGLVDSSWSHSEELEEVEDDDESSLPSSKFDGGLAFATWSFSLLTCIIYHCPLNDVCVLCGKVVSKDDDGLIFVGVVG